MEFGSCFLALHAYTIILPLTLHFLEGIDPIQSVLRIDIRDQSVFSFKRPEFVTGEKRNLAVVQLVDVFPQSWRAYNRSSLYGLFSTFSTQSEPKCGSALPMKKR